MFDSGPAVISGPPFFEIIYTPDLDFTGTDFINYIIEDSAGNQDQGQIIVNVLEPMPVAVLRLPHLEISNETKCGYLAGFLIAPETATPGQETRFIEDPLGVLLRGTAEI